MKLLFSETRSSYRHYLYPYVVWAFPEAHETPADLYARGFLPAWPDLERFHLCRNLRVVLSRFSLTSENRRILRKGEGVSGRIVPRSDFTYTEALREKWHAFARARFGEGIMPYARLDALMGGSIVTHLLVFEEAATGDAVGTVLLFLQPRRVAHYCFAFYELGDPSRNLGMFMMTWAVQHFADQGFDHAYLGTCYSQRALYKTQFRGIEFSTGNGWSARLEELKFLIERDSQDGERHLFDHPDYLTCFYPEGLAGLLAQAHAS